MQILRKRMLFIYVAVILGTFSYVKAESETGIQAITIPSADVTLSFVQPGKIAEILIEEGQTVTAGQLLVRQDDAAEKIVLLQTKAQSEDTSQFQAAKASLDQKRVDLQKLEWVAERGSATPLEVEHARLEVTIAELSLDVAEFEHEQSIRKYQEMKARVDRMSLKSPTDGTVDTLKVEEGEAVNGLDDVVRVVKTDPLWVNVFVPLEQGRTYTNGHPATIAFPGSDLKAKGQIIYVSTIADAASSTLRVKIEVPNKQKRPAGEHVEVFFPKIAEINDPNALP